MMKAPTTNPPQPECEPIYWFARLERALDIGDIEAAAEAQRRLAELGVRVQYGRLRRQQLEVAHG